MEISAEKKPDRQHQNILSTHQQGMKTSNFAQQKYTFGTDISTKYYVDARSDSTFDAV